MMKPIVFTFYIISVLCMGHSASAQSTTTYMDSLKNDVVYLKDGSIFRGTILKYYPNATLKMRILGGVKVKFKASEIEKILQSERAMDRKTLDLQPIKEKGLENHAYFSLLNGTTPWQGNYALGLGINYAMSYKFDRHYSVGIGSGVDYYYILQREILVPIFVEAKRSFAERPTFQSFFQLTGGYGIGLKSETQNVADARGGWMIHPSFGLEFGSTKDWHWQVDAGVRVQQATFTFDNQWNAFETTTHRMTYKRFVIRLGLVF